MSHNTFGHLFRVTTWGESHGPALGCVVDGCPPGLTLHARRHPGRARPPPARPVALRHPAARARPGADPVRRDARRRRRRDADHHRHADLHADRECRPAFQGLWRDRPPVPPGPCRLHLRGQIRPARLSRRRPLLRARDRGAGGGRSHRPPASCRASRCAARWSQMGEKSIDRARWDWDFVDDPENPFFTPDRASVAGLRGLSRRHPQGGLVGRRADRGGRRGRSGRPRRADLRQARPGHRRQPDVDQRRQGRRDRQRLRRGTHHRRGECRRDAQRQ